MTPTNTTTVAFITGANRGIGYETALGLAQKGVTVVIGARDSRQGEATVKKLKDLNLPAEALTFDVTNPAHHQKAHDFFAEKYGKLDILVNNAGIMIDNQNPTQDAARPTSSLPMNLLRETFDTNFFSVVGLTQVLLPLIRKSKAGRIVNLSSILGSLTLHSDPKSSIFDAKVFAYDASKTALNAFTVHLAHELKKTAIKVNSVHPGWVKTDMGGQGATLEVPDGARTSIQLALIPDDGPTGGFFHLGERLPW